MTFAFLAALAAAPFTATDLVSLARVSDPQVSPDGRFVAYVLRETDLEANRGRSDLWLADLDAPGAAPRRLTRDPANDTSPRWAPDGRAIFFLSARSGSSQVWRLPLAGGDAAAVTSLPQDVDSFKVSPVGDRLVFSMAVKPPSKAGEAALEQDKGNGQLYDKLFVRHWDTWADGSRSHLFSARLEAGRLADTPIDLSASLDGDVPSKPFGGDEEYAISPDGKRVVFSLRVAGRTEPWSTNFDLYEIGIDGGAMRNLTAANPAWDTRPVFLANGDLAWLAMERPGFESDRFHVVLRSAQSGVARPLTLAWDRSVADLGASRDGKHLLATADDMGQHALFAIDPASGKVRKLIGEGQVDGFAPARGGTVFAWANLAAPADLWYLRDGGKPVQLTRANGALLAARSMGAFEQFSFPGWNDETVHGYVMKPANFDPARKYPIAFLVHGGPQSSFANGWGYRWNPQAYAGRGYAVVFIDFHGSTVRPGLHRFDQRRLGRQAVRRPAERAGRGAREVRLARRRARLLARRLIRRLHAELDRRQLVRPLPLHRQPRRHLRQPRDVLLDGGTVVPGMGVRRPLLHAPRPVREMGSFALRRQVAHAHARDPRRQGLPRAGHPGAVDLHGLAAARHRVAAALLPGREPLGAEAAQQPAVARRGARLARCTPEAVVDAQTPGAQRRPWRLYGS